ncbi:hypothetical protein HYE68_002650 [Fusarium pseudograminearum]|nr:hypothetical protein HYE68_002650 [Fusarium pseudograminearum]
MGLPQIPDPKTYYRDQTWDAKYSSLSTDALERKRNRIEEQLKKARTEFKRKIFVNDNSDCRERSLKVSLIHVKLARVTSQIELRKDSPETWYNRSEAFNLKLRHDSWTQWGRIIRKQSRVQNATSRESFMRLFVTSRVGLERDTSLQSNMAAEMKRVYCPDPPEEGMEKHRWDPVLHRWVYSDIIHASHLYPWSQGAFMDDIFGRGSSDDLFSPCNGLFLHQEIEAALENGYIAIVPDLDLEPADPKFSLNDKDDRQDRVKEWEKQNPKNYRVIVVDMNHSHVNKKICTKEDMGGFQTIAELHNRKLVFLTGFRPRARYIWWTFLNTILHVAWRSNSKDQNIQHEEVRKTTRYWGSRGKYVTKNQLLGFVEEIGHNVANLLTDENGIEETDGVEPEIEATQALVGAATVRSSKEVLEALAEDDPDYSDDSDEEQF